MDNDDKPTGRLLNRRDALKALGVGSAAFLVAYSKQGIRLVETGNGSAASSASDCIVRPELPIGPYFVDDQLNRSDIRNDPREGADREGIPLALTMLVSDVSNRSCKPLAGARVDVWHCDALGIYSGVSQPGFDTVGQKFLRGYQLTNSKGVVKFLTIYPGWYSGRAVHIHFTIRTKTVDGKEYQFTSQLFFNDKITDIVYTQKPYSVKGKRDTLNSVDIFYKSGGDKLVLPVHGSTSGGYTSAINIGLDLTDAKVGASDMFGIPDQGHSS